MQIRCCRCQYLRMAGVFSKVDTWLLLSKHCVSARVLVALPPYRRFLAPSKHCTVEVVPTSSFLLCTVCTVHSLNCNAHFFQSMTKKNCFSIWVCDGLWLPSKIHCVVKYSNIMFCTYCKNSAMYCARQLLRFTDSTALLLLMCRQVC